MQGIVSQLTADHDRDLFLRSNEPAVVKLQAHWKGHKAREEYSKRKHFLNEQLPAVIKIQVCDKSFEDISFSF